MTLPKPPTVPDSDTTISLHISDSTIRGTNTPEAQTLVDHAAPYPKEKAQKGPLSAPFEPNTPSPLVHCGSFHTAPSSYLQISLTPENSSPPTGSPGDPRIVASNARLTTDRPLSVVTQEDTADNGFSIEISGRIWGRAQMRDVPGCRGSWDWSGETTDAITRSSNPGQ